MNKTYKTKSSAIRGMWRRYDRLYRAEGGNPLIGDHGTLLQWCCGGRAHSLHVTWPDNAGYYDTDWILVDNNVDNNLE